jgi:hypothetical protein
MGFERTGLLLQDGEVESGGQRFVIMQLLGSDLVVPRDNPTVGDGWRSSSSTRLKRLRRRLRPSRISPDSTITTGPKPVAALIAPLLDWARCPRAVIVERARSAGLYVSPLYRWARAYRASSCSHRCFRISLVAAARRADFGRRSSRS